MTIFSLHFNNNEKMFHFFWSDKFEVGQLMRPLLKPLFVNLSRKETRAID